MKRSFASRGSVKRPSRPSSQRPAWWRVAFWCWCLALAGGAQAQDCLTLTGAVELGTNVASVTVPGQVSTTFPSDFYRFVIAGSVRRVTVLLPAASINGSIDLSLLRDANNNGIVDGSDPVFSDSAQGPAFPVDATVTIWLDPGAYFVRVCRSSANTSYSLTLTQTARPESPGNGDNTLVSPNLRTLSAGQPLTDFVGVLDSADYVKFTVTNSVAEVIVAIPGTSLVGLGRYLEVAHIGLKLFPLGAQGNEQVFVSDGGQGSFGLVYDTAVTLWLDQGTYFVKVENAGNEDGTQYQLHLTNRAKLFSPGNGDNSCATARLLQPRAPTNDFVGISDLADFYRVVVSGQAAQVQATIPHTSLSHAVRLRLLTNCSGGELTNAVGDPAFFGSQDAVVSSLLPPGIYYLQVEQANPADHEDNTTYLLSLSAPDPPLPAIQVSGDLAFGDVPTNTTAMRTLTIGNPGTDVLNVSGITYPVGFSGSFSGAIAAGGSTNVTVTFAPVAAGTNGGTVSVNSDAASGISILPISGRGATRIMVLGGSLNFGNVESLQRSNRNLSIQNKGNAPLTVSGLAFPEGFSGSYTGAIPANGSVNVAVTFAPAAATNYSGAVEVISDKTGGTNTITVSGTGTAVKTRIIGLSGNLDFGGVEILRSSNRVLVITNSGQAPFAVSGITYPVGFSGNFTGGVFLVRGWRNVTVTFSPLAENIPYGGPVIVNSPDTNGGINTIQASGTGTPILPRVIELGGELDFGDVQTYQSATRLLHITNSGVAALVVSNITYPAGFSGAFSGVIPPGGRKQVTVKFAPPVAGNYVGELEVHADDNAGTSTRAVSGTGTPAPLRPVAGNYQGVFHQNDAVRHESSGFFTLTAPRKKGAKYRTSYSAKILLAGQELSASGKFDFDGHATNVIKRKGKDAIRVEWHADPQGGDEITGMIIAPSWEATLLGHRAVYASKTNDAPQAGTYTMIFPGIPGAEASPQGDGFGTVSVSERGVISLAGALADGTKVTRSANLSRQGDWPLYVNLYKGRGSLLGRLIFASSVEEDLGGRASWIRPAIAKSIYPDGFEVNSETTGSRYLAPAGKTNRIVTITNAIVAFTGGNLSPALECDALLTAGNKVSNASPHILKMTITKSSGRFSGSLMLNGTKKEIPFQGVFLQRTNPVGYGAGYFLREKLSGRVEFRAAP